MPERLKKFRELSLRKQVALFMTLGIVITAVAMTAVNYFIYRSHIKEVVERDLLRKTAMKAEAFNSFIELQQERAALITSRSQMRNLIIGFLNGKITKFNFQRQMDTNLNSTLRASRSIRNISITNLQGELLYTTDPNADLSQLQQLIRSDQLTDSFRLFPPRQSGEDYTSQIVGLVRDFQGNPLAYALMKINVNEFKNVLLSGAQAQDFSLLFLRNEQDQYIRLLIPAQLPDGRGPIIPFSEAPPYLLASTDPVGKQGVYYLKDSEGVELLVSTARLDPTNWIALVGTDKDIVFGAFNRRIGIIALAILLIAILMIFFSYQFAFQVAIPLVKMSNQAKELAKGNFNISFDQVTSDAEEEDPRDELAHSLNHMTQDIKKYIEFRDGFLSLAAHELKTPLSVIQSYLDLITMEDYRNESTKDDFIKSVRRQCKLLNVLINDLLEVSRLQMGRFQLNKKKGDLSEVIESLVTELNALEQKNKIVLLNKVKKLIPFDEQRIEQVILNLISNSIKFSKEGSDIFIQMEEVGPNLRISVHDKGAGIPKDKQELIFKQLYKESQEMLPPEKKSRTLGVSLYVCKAIIDKHHGSIWFESKENVGTSFYFELPTKEATVLKSA